MGTVWPKNKVECTIFSLNFDSCSSVEALQQPPQRSSRQGDAAGRRQKTFSRQMDEDGAAAPCHARADIVVDLDDEVVEVVGAPKAVGARGAGELDRPVVASIGRLLAPAVIRPRDADGQRGARPRASIRTPPDPDRVEKPARGCPVPFALVRLNAAAAEGHRNGQAAREQPTLAGPPRPRSYPNMAERPPYGGFCRTKAMIFSTRKAF